MTKTIHSKAETGKIIDGNIEYLVLREWNKATPFVIAYYRKGMGYYWGNYLHTSNLKEAKVKFYEKLQEIDNISLGRVSK